MEEDCAVTVCSTDIFPWKRIYGLMQAIELPAIENQSIHFILILRLFVQGSNPAFKAYFTIGSVKNRHTV